jgi:hypothetical protein
VKLIFPSDILKQHVCVLGKTGSGKSSALRYIVEHLLDDGKRVCVIDPKGDWAGIKVGGDGKSPGFPAIGFGDFKEPKGQDVPIDEHSGKHIAELITSGNRPCIIGFRGWTQGAMIRFWIDFAQTLFNANSGELYLIGDEFHNFAPKGKILDPEAGKCLHWSNRLMSEGRGYGLVCLIASQRPQKVHNDTLTCCETLIAMRVIHKADRDAVEDWIDGCGDAEKGKEVLNSLAGMARGEAYVWSPEIGFGPKRLTFPMFKTFDSFAPPQLQKAVSTNGWSTVDLSVVKEKLAAVIEEHKANDPKELKAQIRRLERQLAEVQPVEKVVPEYIRLYTDQDVTELLSIQDSMRQLHPIIDSVVERARKIIDQKLPTLEEVQRIYKRSEPAAAPPRNFFLNEHHELHTTKYRARKEREDAQENGAPSGGVRRMMIALAQRPGLNKQQLGVRAGLSSMSGTFGTYLARMRSQGWICDDGGEQIGLTKDGLKALGNYQPLPAGEQLYEYWRNQLGGGAGRMLEVLYRCYRCSGIGNGSMTKEELGKAAGISHMSGTFGTYLAKLRALELITGKHELQASEEFFQ